MGTPGDEANVASVLCSWSTHVRSWCQSGLPRLQVIRYEDLLDDGPGTLATNVGANAVRCIIGLSQDLDE